MKISKGIKIVDHALLIGKTLVISDLHIGYEEALNKKGVLIPRFQFEDLIKHLKNLLHKTKPNVVVINGDLKHEFGKISETEWRDTLKVLDLLLSKCKVVLVKGNHDTTLDPIAEKRDVEVVDKLIIKNIAIVHGDVDVKLGKEITTVIIGHEHPAISLKEGARTEKYKCFLRGKWKGKELIVQPSLNPITYGNDVLSNKPIGPIVKKYDDFEVFVVGDEILEFGKVKKLREKF